MWKCNRASWGVVSLAVAPELLWRCQTAPAQSGEPLLTDLSAAPIVERAPTLFPTFEELHERLYDRKVDEDDNSTHVVLSFTNPYNIRPSFNNYPHSNLLPEFFSRLLDILAPEGGPRFIVEAGSLHGHSAVQMGSVLDRLGLTRVPILCIDPFTGDTNMWANYKSDQSVQRWVNIQDGRMMTFDQFMANVQFAESRTLSRWHILPFHATGTVGARFLKQAGYTPDLIFLDSAHEEHETLLEITLFFNVLAPGGILFGDDYGWPAVQADVHRFRDRHNALHLVDNPVELTVARAKEGAANMLWILRKAKV